MKSIFFFTAMLAGATLAGSWTSAQAADCVANGIVESVREVQLDTVPAALGDVFEHTVKPQTGDELVVRLKDGRAISVTPDAMQRFRPGEHVVVIRASGGVRVERG